MEAAKQQEAQPAPDVRFGVELHAVDSSQLKSCGYNLETGKLFVEFKGGSVYRYDNVAVETFQEMMQAESKGRFFISSIKKFPDKYPFVRVRDTDEQEAKKAEAERLARPV